MGGGRVQVAGTGSVCWGSIQEYLASGRGKCTRGKFTKRDQSLIISNKKIYKLGGGLKINKKSPVWKPRVYVISSGLHNSKPSEYSKLACIARSGVFDSFKNSVFALFSTQEEGFSDLTKIAAPKIE